MVTRVSLAALLVTCGVCLVVSGCSGNGRPLDGQLLLDPEHPGKLVYNRDSNGDGRLDPAFLCGPGGPEGFFFGDISGGDNQDSVIAKIARNGGNAIYLIAVRSHGGDGKPDHNPFVDHDPGKGVDPAVLRTWKGWLARLGEHGVVALFFLYDDEACVWPGDEVGAEERAFIHALVDELADLPNLVWIIGEEYSEALSPRKVSQIAEILRREDPHRHLIGVHQLPSTRFDFAHDNNIDLFAMQLGKSVDTLDKVHAACLEAVQLAAGRYAVVLAELYPWHARLVARRDRDTVRRINWAAATAGVCGVLQVGTWETPKSAVPEVGPPTPGMLGDYRRLHRFLEAQADLNSMTSCDSLVSFGKAWVLGAPGHYIAYLPEGGTIRLDLREEGPLKAEWYDPRTGDIRDAGTVQSGDFLELVAPDGQDWVLHLRAGS